MSSKIRTVNLKLINSERKQLKVLSAKLCNIDQAPCTNNSTDLCYNQDYAQCSINAYDECKYIDLAACYMESHDYCGSDYDSCYGGATDYCANTDN